MGVKEGEKTETEWQYYRIALEMTTNYNEAIEVIMLQSNHLVIYHN